MRRYYAVRNKYGNTWNVLVFDSKDARDQFCKQDRLDHQPIKRSEIGRYIKRPSSLCGTALFIDPSETSFEGEIGTVVFDSSIYPRWGLIRFY